MTGRVRIVIHSRESTDILIDLIKEINLPDLRGIFHCFGGSVEEYQELFESDFEIRIMETAYNSIPPRHGNEVFINFQKKDLN